MSQSAPAEAPLDLRERGAPKDGEPQLLDARLFMQLLVVRPENASPSAASDLGEAIGSRGASVVIYEDVCDPFSLGVLTWSTNPKLFVEKVRPAIRNHGGGHTTVLTDFTMLGRTYSTGYEQDLEYWMLRRPVETVMNPDHPWAIWYPLRRSGAFEKLDPREKGGVLREHGDIGKRYGGADLAHDVRLACHGLDANDNEFVIGLIGRDLHPLSHVVQTMRGTRQTSEFIAKMGPFFVGHAIFRHEAV